MDITESPHADRTCDISPTRQDRGAVTRRLALALAAAMVTVFVSLVSVSSPAAAEDRQGGWKSCPKGTHVVIVSDAIGLVTHKFSRQLIGSGDAKVFRHAFGPPPLGDTNVTFTWKRSVWWQVHAADSEVAGRKIVGGIDDVTVSCESVTASAKSGSKKNGGYKTCPAGKYVWIGLQAWGNNLVRWYTGSNKPYKNVRRTINYSDSTPTIAVPTWQRSVYWRVYNWGTGSKYVNSKVWCAKSSGGDFD